MNRKLDNRIRKEISVHTFSAPVYVMDKGNNFEA